MNHYTPTRQALTDLLTDHGVTDLRQAIPAFPVVVAIEGNEVQAIVSLAEFYPEDGEVIAGVTRTLEWYAKTFTGGEDNPGNLNKLIGAQTYLARQREYLGVITGKAQADKTAAEYRRRSHRDTLMLTYRATGDTMAEATAKARRDTTALDQEHADSIEYYTRLRALQDSVDATMTAILQERKRLASDYERAHLTH